MPIASTSKWIGRINERNHLSGRYSLAASQYLPGVGLRSILPGGPQGGGFQGTGDQTAYSTGVNYDHVFSPMLTEVTRRRRPPAQRCKAKRLRLGRCNNHRCARRQYCGPAIHQRTGRHHHSNWRLCQPTHWLFSLRAVDPSRVKHRFVNNWTKVIRNHTIKCGCRYSPCPRRSLAGPDLQPPWRIYLRGPADLAHDWTRKTQNRQDQRSE